MTVKYLYIDDESVETLQPYIRAVQGDSNILNIDTEPPKPFDEQINHLVGKLHAYDGLLLDWRLDQKRNPEGKQVQFRAAALAQEIRTRSTEGGVKELPIVLWSTYPKLDNSYHGDQTSHDLFDRRYDKEEIVEKADLVRNEFISLAQGYKVILKALSSPHTLLQNILVLEEKDLASLDQRFVAHFNPEKHLRVHEYARFLLKEVIGRPGPLISTRLLASRLGVDIGNSPDWGFLLNRLPDNCRYRGAFHEAWPRWWWPLIEIWWRSLGTKPRPLSVHSAQERVDVLQKYAGLQNLMAATPIKESYGDRFQTICEFYRAPLDPVDGVTIDEAEPEPWQQRRYMSLDAALERRGYDEWLRPHPTEMKRIREIRKYRTDGTEEKG